MIQRTLVLVKQQNHLTILHKQLSNRFSLAPSLLITASVEARLVEALEAVTMEGLGEGAVEEMEEVVEVEELSSAAR